MIGSFVFSYRLSVREIAFSQPTDKGKALASKYCGDEYLVYKG
jgi:hypothetical protein